MASNSVGFIHVGASQFGTATKQVYEVPADVCTSIDKESDPFYATRIDVVSKRRPLDLTEFIESAVPMTEARDEGLAHPSRERRIVTMKKRG